MKVLIFLGALVVVGLIVTGAIKFQKPSDSTLSIQIDKSLVKKDASRVVEGGKHLFQEAKSTLHKAAHDHDQN